MKRVIFGLVCACIVVILTVFLLQLPAVQLRLYGAEITRIKQAGKLIVAIDPTYPPMESVTETGEIVGFDVDIATEIAGSIGVPLEIKHVLWDDFFPSVNRGDVDFAISSIIITPERTQIVLFSNPYFSSGQSIIVREGDTSIKGPGDLAKKRVAAQVDTTGGIEAGKYTDAPNVFLYESTYDESVEGILAGSMDALIIDLPAGANIIRTTKGLQFAGEPFTAEYYGIAVRRGNTELMSKINETIETIKSSGKYDELKRKWFP